MAHLNAYLYFDGNCAEAMRFCERVFGGELDMLQTYGESPAGGVDAGQQLRDDPAGPGRR